MKKNIEVPALSRVEGEGALYIRLKDGSVAEIEVNIYEPPRFFEGFLRGRFIQEVPDITARICGICPVAYQTSSVQAFERALGIAITPEIRSLRRLFYCGEYIESHALHIYLLQAPDLFGVESALTLAEIAPDVVKRALRMKKVGNDILRIIGGRSVHPVNACIGGFYRWPNVENIKAIIPDLEWCLEAAVETLRWSVTLPYPQFEEDYEFVALHHDNEYGILEGDVWSSKGTQISVDEFEKFYLEEHVRHSNALHSRNREGEPYITGPLARFNLNFDQLRPVARKICEELNIVPPLKNPYKALIARAVEILTVTDEALELVNSYNSSGPSRIELNIQAGEGAGASEAPRGLLYHRYIFDEKGLVRFAKIVPPTAQNLARMEADLWDLAPNVLDLPLEEATLACEHLIRSYDPCISCATHFLQLKIEHI